MKYNEGEATFNPSCPSLPPLVFPSWWWPDDKSSNLVIPPTKLDGMDLNGPSRNTKAAVR